MLKHRYTFKKTKQQNRFTRIHNIKHYRTPCLIIYVQFVKLTVGFSPCSYEALIKNDLILMNWVDYAGHIMAVQGYVSLQKSIGAQAEHKAALTPVPWDMTVHLRVRVGRVLQRDCSSGFGLFFSSPYRSNGSTFFTLSNIPFQGVSWNTFDTFSWHRLWCLLP